ncbi:MAG: Holliday junction branch migration protein RuvA [Fusobacterium sp. JB021]|nr:Holliday junction branch migration protein RuvA [Fusobacterium sp. JB020]MDP0494467.1 Holliday junction branch migration protein RuvA [Fusobacterium sp. JB021]MDP0506820.1 Holliday junction branch migration protein RuvA [Fusobacterium sp. JB019]
MFDFLRGKVDYKTTNYVAIDVNGVGYKVFISLRTYDLISDGEDIKVYIYNHIKEEEFKLVGFLNRAERNLFEMLLSVKGVGVSLALAIMSTFDIDTIKALILSEDYLTLKKVPKLGQKKSQQIILDLKDKISKLEVVSGGAILEIEKQSNIEEELIMALEGLGYNKKDIAKLIDKEALKTYKNIQEAIKETLRKI